MNLYVAIGLFIATLFIDVYTDYKKWLEHKSVNHKAGFWLRLFGLIPSIYFFSVHIGWTWPYIIISIILSSLMVAINYNNLFDGLYNGARGYGWFFTGSDDKDDAKTDNFYQSISLLAQVLIKIGGSIATILLYIFIT